MGDKGLFGYAKIMFIRQSLPPQAGGSAGAAMML